MSRKSINTTLDTDLYTQLQILAVILSQENDKKINTNDLLEDGMRIILEQNKEKIKGGYLWLK